MTVISTTKDADALTMTVVADLDASIDRVWQLWEDPRQLELVDGFSLPDGEPDPTQRPITAVVTADEVDGKTRMTMVTRFVDSEQLEQMLAMGMDEGLVEAMGQIDPLLATGPAD